MGRDLLLPSGDDDAALLDLSVGVTAVAGSPGRARRRSTKVKDAIRRSMKEFRSDKRYQSLAYEQDESEVWRYFEATRRKHARGRCWTVRRSRSTKRWLIVGATGSIIAALGVTATWFCGVITDWKFDTVQSILNRDGAAAAYFAYLSLNLFLVSIAAACVMLEPVAAGSGIPEVKCFLNGINLPRVMRIKTLCAKLFGVIFSVAGGLPCGKEGPMIHSGACVGAGVSQGKSSSIGFDVGFSWFQDFRNDREKRDFVACGAAAGVCTAFHAPIGGVLFALEEGASHWSAALTWRTFFCTMISLYTLYIGNEVLVNRGFDKHGNMFSFGKFASIDGEGTLNYDVWELIMFALLGVAGGLIGALFNTLNKWLTIRRKKIFGFTGTVSHKSRSLKKYSEVLVVAAIMSTLSFVLPYMWTHCRDLPSVAAASTQPEQDQILIDNLVQFQCPSGKYNELASLMFTGQDVAIRHLFHFRELGDGTDEDTTFQPSALVTFFVAYTIMAVVTYGLAVPSGLFVPSLLSGAAFGRLVASLLHSADNYNGTFADAGTYALVGAVASLGGMARMTISLTVIMLEATGDMQYVLPLMITLMASRWSGNAICDGLYDIHIHLNKLPILEADPPETARKHDMCVREIMSSSVVTLAPVVEVGDLYDILKQNNHGCFPVVDNGDLLQGLIVRKRIAMIFAHKAFGIGPNTGWGKADMAATTGSLNADESGVNLTSRTVSSLYGDEATSMSPNTATEVLSPLLTWDVLERPYPRYPDLLDFPPTDDERSMIVDLRPYINTSPYTVHESTSVVRAYNIFRELSMRQLCVVNTSNRCIGVITRYDLLQERLEQLATLETDWTVNPTELPDIVRSRGTSDRAHAFRPRRLVSVKDGDGVVAFRFTGGDFADSEREAPSPLAPRSTALGEMV